MSHTSSKRAAAPETSLIGRFPAPMPLEIIAVDARLIVVDKPSGLLCVPGRGPDKQDSLLGRLQVEWPGVLLVHRLDRDTSGIVLFARDEEAQRMLARQFQERTVEKR